MIVETEQCIFESAMYDMRSAIKGFREIDIDDVREIAEGELGLSEALLVGHHAVRYGYEVKPSHTFVSEVGKRTAAAVTMRTPVERDELKAFMQPNMCDEVEPRFIELLQKLGEPQPKNEETPLMTLHLEDDLPVAVTKYFGDASTLVLRSPGGNTFIEGMLVAAKCAPVYGVKTNIEGVLACNFDVADYTFLRFTTFAFPRSYTEDYIPKDISPRLAKYAARVPNTTIDDIRSAIDVVAKKALD